MDQPTDQQIEDLLFNRLPEQEAEKLRARAQTDEAFAETLALRQLEIDAMALAEEDEIRNSMASWTIADTTEKSQTSPLKVVHRRRSFTRVLSIAASVLFLIFAGTTFFASSNYSDAALAGRYAQSRVAGARGTTDATLLAPVKALMADKKYAEAVTALAAMEGNSAAMLRGEALLKLERYQESIAAYDTVLASNSQLAYEAAFQRAIALLASGEEAAARTAFTEVAGNPANPFAQNAEEVLRELDAFWRNLAWW